jgi:hypothetical protein
MPAWTNHWAASVLSSHGRDSRSRGQLAPVCVPLRGDSSPPSWGVVGWRRHADPQISQTQLGEDYNRRASHGDVEQSMVKPLGEARLDRDT